ncbi:MAG: class I SAM-dependent methyltransferase [Deltaproteobacteria bacterium]|nr:class I SAM-dependent methyltransferase [Deltaproteobacteria bacterium]
MVRRHRRERRQRVRKSAQIQLADFDRYEFYQKSVQSPEEDVLFLERVYRELKGRDPAHLREDFCGAFALSCAWVRLQDHYRASGIDNDPDPLDYGKTHYLAQLSQDERDRLVLSEQDVLEGPLPGADLVCALNFSYFCFKQRPVLLRYFRSVYASLNEGGLLFLDCFGGSKCCEPNEEETEYEDEQFSYFWDQDSFDPVTNFAQFYIHFKRYGEKKREKVFSYDWRMWSIPELRDLLTEAGFSRTHVYWEGNDEDGEGNGEYSRVSEGEPCEAWVAYIVAEK